MTSSPELEPCAEFDHVYQTYGTPKIVINEISFELLPKEVVGLLGNNGAGKTSIIRMLCGLRRPSFGAVRRFSEDAYRATTGNQQKIGYVPSELPTFNQRVSHLCAQVSALYRRWDSTIIERFLDQGAISKHSWVSSLSSGQKRLLIIALSLAHYPFLVIWDEPYNSLDTASRLFLSQMVKGYRASQPLSTFFISSHLIHDIDGLCNRVIIMKDGAIVQSGFVWILASELRQLTIMPHDNADLIRRNLSGLRAYIAPVSNGRIKIICSRNDTIIPSLLNGFEYSESTDVCLEHLFSFYAHAPACGSSSSFSPHTNPLIP